MRSLIQSVLVIAALALSACATTTTTETRRMYVETQSVAPGDDVRVTTNDGRRMDFRVTSADKDTIRGKGVAVNRAELSSLKSIQTSTVTTQESSPQPVVQAVGTTLSTAVITVGVIAVVAILAF